MSEPFEEKMAEWELYAKAAHRYMIDWLREEPETLLALARGRVAWGHYRHGDALMYELDQAELMANASEEIADCVNYLARLLYLRESAASGAAAPSAGAGSSCAGARPSSP